MIFLCTRGTDRAVGADNGERNHCLCLGPSSPPVSTRASAGLLADNFLDVAHFPFVHAGTFGAGEAAEVPRDVVARHGWSFTMTYEHTFANREDPGVIAGVRPLMQPAAPHVTNSTPRSICVCVSNSLDAGRHQCRSGSSFSPNPQSRAGCSPPCGETTSTATTARMKGAIDFEMAVLREDLLVQEAYDHLVLPLHPTAEVHTRADRTTLELRRLLADLVESGRCRGPHQAM